MRLKAVTIKDFKRFTNLTVRNIPESARLIVLAGPNGCGKSSFFDALRTWHGLNSGKNASWEPDYHRKAGTSHQDQRVNDVEIESHGQSSNNKSRRRFSILGRHTETIPNFKCKGYSDWVIRWMRAGWDV